MDPGFPATDLTCEAEVLTPVKLLQMSRGGSRGLVQSEGRHGPMWTDRGGLRPGPGCVSEKLLTVGKWLSLPGFHLCFKMVLGNHRRQSMILLT